MDSAGLELTGNPFIPYDYDYDDIMQNRGLGITTRNSYYPPDPATQTRENVDYRTVKQAGRDCGFAAIVVSLAKARPQDINVYKNGDGTFSVKLAGEKMPVNVDIQKAQAAPKKGESYSYSAGSPWLQALEIAVGQVLSPLKNGKYTRHNT